MKTKKIKIFALESEDLSTVGGPMGSERVTTNWTKYFKHKDHAKAHAEKDYQNQTGGNTVPIKWKQNCSGDLGFVMYSITKIKLED